MPAERGGNRGMLEAAAPKNIVCGRDGVGGAPCGDGGDGDSSGGGARGTVSAVEGHCSYVLYL